MESTTGTWPSTVGPVEPRRNLALVEGRVRHELDVDEIVLTQSADPAVGDRVRARPVAVSTTQTSGGRRGAAKMQRGVRAVVRERERRLGPVRCGRAPSGSRGAGRSSRSRGRAAADRPAVLVDEPREHAPVAETVDVLDVRVGSSTHS